MRAQNRRPHRNPIPHHPTPAIRTCYIHEWIPPAAWQIRRNRYVVLLDFPSRSPIASANRRSFFPRGTLWVLPVVLRFFPPEWTPRPLMVRTVSAGRPSTTLPMLKTLCNGDGLGQREVRFIFSILAPQLTNKQKQIKLENFISFPVAGRNGRGPFFPMAFLFPCFFPRIHGFQGFSGRFS